MEELDILSTQSEPTNRQVGASAAENIPADAEELEEVIAREEAELADRRRAVSLDERRDRLRNLRIARAQLELQPLQPRPPTSPRVRPARPRRDSGSESDAVCSNQETPVSTRDLRRIDAIRELAKKKTDRLALFDRSSQSSDSSSEEETRSKRRNKKTKKKKSGKLDKVSSHVRFSERWPHAYLASAQVGSEEKTYDTLSMPEFVAGYTTILTLPELSDRERRERTTHLSHLMYLAQIYEWTAVLSFHAAVLTQIERGACKWGDRLSIAQLESRTLAGRFLCKASAQKDCSSRTGPTARRVFCKEFNLGTCKYEDSHVDDFMGVQRNMLHACSDCLLKTDKAEPHKKGDVACPFSR